MKLNSPNKKIFSALAFILTTALVLAMFATCVFAEGNGAAVDNGSDVSAAAVDNAADGSAENTAAAESTPAASPAANNESQSEKKTFSEVFSALNKGFVKTFEVFIFTLIGAIPLGLLICLGSMCKLKIVQLPVRALIWIIRGTPLMLQLIVIFYGPGLIFESNPWNYMSNSRLMATLLAFIINYACYFSEIYRGGIESIANGQYEAGAVLGMTKSQTFFKVVLLQVIKRIIPSMSNEIITLVKDTSLARIIAVYEIIYEGERFIKNGGIIWPLLFTGVYYLLFSGLLTVLLRQLEKKLEYIK